MVDLTIELDIVSAVIADFLMEKNGPNLFVDFLAQEVKQTSFSTPQGETNPTAGRKA